MKNKLEFIIIAIILCIIPLSAGWGDIVFLKNGKIIEGQVKSSEGATLLVDTPGGTVSVVKEMVDRIQHEAPKTEFTNFIIEICSEIKKANAERAFNYLSEKGYTNAHMVYENPYYKVQIGPFVREGDAIAAVKVINGLSIPFANPDGSKIIQISAKQVSTFFESTKTNVVETNIALEENGAKIFADSSKPGFPANKAIDGNNTNKQSRWISANTPGSHYLIVDFGENKIFDRIELFTGGELDSQYLVRNFTVQYWDGIEWQDLGGAKDNLIENPIFTFDPVTSNRVRLYITASNYLDNAARVLELKVLSKERMALSPLPVETKVHYILDISQPSFLVEEPHQLTVKAGEWYTLPVKLTYDINTQSGLNANIWPDSEQFWSDMRFRDYLEINPKEYSSTLSYDSKNSDTIQILTGTGEFEFTLKSKAPAKPGKYVKKLRCNLYNPVKYGVQKVKEVPFDLIVE
jgi:hypothetical protein